MNPTRPIPAPARRGSPTRRLAAALAVLAGLGACAAPDEAPPAASASAFAPAEDVATGQDPVPGTAGAPLPAAGLAALPAATAAASRPPAPRVADPRQLVGMSPGEVRDLIGDPGFRRIDDPSLIWQYQGPGCILDVFLYRERSDFRVVEVAVRAPALGPSPMGGAVKLSAEACLFGLLRRRGRGVSS
ncbi:MAG: hypothetical protein HY521_13535 [Proteobacteria bacterium]|nr:hypothetical protein [Pseudomonadota bacterium]